MPGRNQLQSDRAYQQIKARVIAYEYPQGRRIYLGPIAKQLGVSATPVQEALNRLAGECLVRKAPKKGFLANTFSEDNLLEQYSLTRTFLTYELARLEPKARRSLSRHKAITGISSKLNGKRLTDASALAARTGEIFTHIAYVRDNASLADLINAANDQLYYIRTLECEQLDDVQSELARLCRLFLAGHCKRLITAIDRYHERRIELLPKLLRIATK